MLDKKNRNNKHQIAPEMRKTAIKTFNSLRTKTPYEKLVFLIGISVFQKEDVEDEERLLKFR
jgi:hypothetical protein